eukprot:scaffold18086_cov112-Isochrysis_galbana.AAC.6
MLMLRLVAVASDLAHQFPGAACDAAGWLARVVASSRGARGRPFWCQRRARRAVIGLRYEYGGSIGSRRRF